MFIPHFLFCFLVFSYYSCYLKDKPQVVFDYFFNLFLFPELDEFEEIVDMG